MTLIEGAAIVSAFLLGWAVGIVQTYRHMIRHGREYGWDIRNWIDDVRKRQ